MDWAHRIKQYRVSRGLIQSALAYELSVDVTTVSRWERRMVIPELGMQNRLRRLMGDPITLPDAALRMLVEGQGSPCNLLDRNLNAITHNKALIELTEGDAIEGVGRHVYHAWPDEKIGTSKLFVDDFSSGFMSQPLNINEEIFIQPRGGGKPFGLQVQSNYIPVIGGDRERYLICMSKVISSTSIDSE